MKRLLCVLLLLFSVAGAQHQQHEHAEDEHGHEHAPIQAYYLKEYQRAPWSRPEVVESIVKQDAVLAILLTGLIIARRRRRFTD